MRVGERRSEASTAQQGPVLVQRRVPVAQAHNWERCLVADALRNDAAIGIGEHITFLQHDSFLSRNVKEASPLYSLTSRLAKEEAQKHRNDTLSLERLRTRLKRSTLRHHRRIFVLRKEKVKDGRAKTGEQAREKYRGVVKGKAAEKEERKSTINTGKGGKKINSSHDRKEA